jgi:hypothetical protein
MEETSLYSAARKNRREALGLLLGAAFIAPAAFAQPTKPPKWLGDAFPIVIETDPKGGVMINDVFKHPKLSHGNWDVLVLVNLHSSDVWFRVEDADLFDQGQCCKVDTSKRYVVLRLKQPKENHTYKFCVGVGNKCPDECPPSTRSGGDITIQK